jgi:hypothetical protein
MSIGCSLPVLVGSLDFRNQSCAALLIIKASSRFVKLDREGAAGAAGFLQISLATKILRRPSLFNRMARF